MASLIRAILAVIAISLAAWSVLAGVGVGRLPGCGGGSSCRQITTGRWSRLGPVPVAAIGLTLYLLLFAIPFVRPGRGGGGADRLATDSIAFVSVCCLGGAVWFVVLMAVVIRRWCSLCLTTHVAAGLASTLFLYDSRSHVDGGVLVLATSATVVFILGQYLWLPTRHALISLPTREPNVASPAPVNQGADVVPNAIDGPKAAHPQHRTVKLAGGRVELDVFDFPILGDPLAPNVVAAMVDFTCEECHHLHRLLRPAVRHFAGRLAVSVIPVPLHEACNGTVKCHRPEQAYACRYARLAWKTWLTNNAAYDDWDQFLAEPAEGLPYGLALLKAKELVGESFPGGEGDLSMNQYIESGILLYERATRPKVPALVLGTGFVQGRVPDLATLVKLLMPHLAGV